MAVREFDFDNCAIDDILEFSHRNYNRDKEDIDKKISDSKQKVKSEEETQKTSEEHEDENLDKKSKDTQ